MSNQVQGQQQEQREAFLLTPQMFAIITDGLQHLPYGQSAPVIQDLQMQVQEMEQRAKAANQPEVEPEAVQEA